MQHGGQCGTLYQWPWLLKGHQNVPVAQWQRAKGEMLNVRCQVGREMERGGHARGLGVSKSWAWHCSASRTRTLGVSKTELELHG